MTKKGPFDIFSEKLGNYKYREVKNASDAVSVVRYMRDSVQYFENKQKAKSISAVDLKDPINTAIQHKRVEKYVNRESLLRIKLDKIMVLYGVNDPMKSSPYFSTTKILKISQKFSTFYGYLNNLRK